MVSEDVPEEGPVETIKGCLKVYKVYVDVLMWENLLFLLFGNT